MKSATRTLKFVAAVLMFLYFICPPAYADIIYVSSYSGSTITNAAEPQSSLF